MKVLSPLVKLTDIVDCVGLEHPITLEQTLTVTLSDVYYACTVLGLVDE
jgi:hypothetical protein